jgi:hypothetical protein
VVSGRCCVRQVVDRQAATRWSGRGVMRLSLDRSPLIVVCACESAGIGRTAPRRGRGTPRRLPPSRGPRRRGIDLARRRRQHLAAHGPLP